jgi:hypothetical protein
MNQLLTHHLLPCESDWLVFEAHLRFAMAGDWLYVRPPGEEPP